MAISNMNKKEYKKHLTELDSEIVNWTALDAKEILVEIANDGFACHHDTKQIEQNIKMIAAYYQRNKPNRSKQIDMAEAERRFNASWELRIFPELKWVSGEAVTIKDIACSYELYRRGIIKRHEDKSDNKNRQADLIDLPAIILKL